MKRARHTCFRTTEPCPCLRQGWEHFQNRGPKSQKRDVPFICAFLSQSPVFNQEKLFLLVEREISMLPIPVTAIGHYPEPVSPISQPHSLFAKIHLISASYSKVSEFKSRPGDRLFWRVFRGFSQSLQENRETVHDDPFLPRLLQFIIHKSS
jgi:hypothetical protein